MNNNLSINTLHEMPQPKENAKEIIALVKENGYVVGYKLSDGNVLDKEYAVEMARHGEIKGVGIALRDGKEYLKSIPDDTQSNNLGNLPSITE